MPLKHLSNFWGTLEMPYCEINIILTWSVNCIVFEYDRATTFVIRDTKLYVTAVILSTKIIQKITATIETSFQTHN